MKTLPMGLSALALALMPMATDAQSLAGKSIQAPGGYLPAQAIYCDDGTGHAILCSLGGVRESFALIASNTPSASAAVYGGDYILSQACSGYGTLNLQALGPDGVTWQTLVSKTASDAAGGTGMSLGSFAQVRITVTGTTSCNAILARVPA